jgi:hypothetical protein
MYGCSIMKPTKNREKCRGKGTVTVVKKVIEGV